MGYAITWSRAGCVVRHPRLGNVECWLGSGCPVVRKDHALALITEIEHMEMGKRTNHRLTLEEPTEKTKRRWGSRFPETPERIWNYMRGQDEEDPQLNHDLPWNRHKRRSLLTSKGVIVHLLLGKGRKNGEGIPSMGLKSSPWTSTNAETKTFTIPEHGFSSGNSLAWENFWASLEDLHVRRPVG